MARTAALVLLIGAVLAVTWRWGSFVAGGSDSACYAVQAVRWARLLAEGAPPVQAPDPLALSAPWPDATAALTPTGHLPSQVVRGAFVPICPSGLSLVMAPLYLAGGTPLMFAAVPLFGVILVVATYAVGARFGTRIGLSAATLAAASPVFLYQVVQPMSDVPAAALWIVAVACATGTKRHQPMLAGLATSGAILMRPNLVPLGVAIGVFLLLRPERSWGQRLRSAWSYALWSAPGCLAVAGVQQYFYGSPLASGYGTYSTIFSADRIVPNATRYLSWLWSGQSPALLLALAAMALLPGPLTALLLTLFVVNLAVYLPYVVFDDWSYLRFLLPAIPLLLVLVAAVIDGVAVRALGSGLAPAGGTLRRRTSLALTVATMVLAALFVQQARTRHAFELRRLEARFPRAGRFVAERLPPNAMVITDYESASVWFYSGRRTLAWGALDPGSLDRAIGFVRESGFEPFLLFERAEEPKFRARFGSVSSLGALDWPPMAEVSSEVRIYRVADRDRYREGQSVRTEYAR